MLSRIHKSGWTLVEVLLNVAAIICAALFIWTGGF